MYFLLSDGIISTIPLCSEDTNDKSKYIGSIPNKSSLISLKEEIFPLGFISSSFLDIKAFVVLLVLDSSTND